MYSERIFVRFARLMFLVLLFSIVFSQTACKKWLDKKPNQSLAVPSTLKDLQALLDNETANFASPGDLEFVADNYYLTTIAWQGNIEIQQRLNYIWDKNARPTSEAVWNAPYYAIFQANLVLDQLPKIQFDELNRPTYDNVKGTALFYRSFLFHQLAQLYCRPYSSSANTDPGIPLHLSSDVNARTFRNTVQQTYELIISDLKTAASLLPATNTSPIRPSKAAAYAELARVYLSMSDFVNAGKFADSSLSSYDLLLDYNSLTSLSALPSYSTNPEILYLSRLNREPGTPRDAHQELIDSTLYNSYDINDIRKTVFFAPNPTTPITYYWRGSYFNYGSTIISFDGLATDEVWLIRAECKARSGDVAGAMSDLTTLMRKRWKTGTYNDTTASSASDALNKILKERRKELAFRGLRWSDLRRFNLEGAGISLQRIIDGVTYTLPPNDLRWVLLIPDVEIQRSDIAQNPR